MVNPRVKVQEGELEGTVEVSLEGKDYFSFKGIPYAEPPLGDLRFKPPVPRKHWNGVRDASKEGEACPQYDFIQETYIGSEDCLFLNVFTPRLPELGSEEKRDDLFPVMLYIHGGGFVAGSGSVDWFSPDFIVVKDTILVTINYRLGVLGFLCLDIPDAPGNVGLRDQNLAMRWVQENIKAFNGDPDNVTIFGISAGSASVEYHLLSPMSEGLFHKAILQSGSSLNPWAKMRDFSKIVKKLSNNLGTTIEDPEKLVEYLQGVDIDQLIISAFKVTDADDIKAGELFPFTPVVEKSLPGVEPFLIVKPLDVLTSGKFNCVPTITGFCQNEGGAFKFNYEEHIDNLKKRKFIDYLPPSFEVDRVHYNVRLRETYNQEDDIEAVDAFLSDVCFLGGINQSLKSRIKNNQLANFFYTFTYDGSLNFLKILMDITEKGAFHSDETTYLASSIIVKDIVPTAKDVLVRSRMVQMWTDFAKTGHPTPEQSDLVPIEWLPVTTLNMILMDIGEDLKMKTFPLLERMDLWESLYDSSIVPADNLKLN